jgi:hypothetical protein
MFETIRISLFNSGSLSPCGNRLVAAALIATLFSLPVPTVWAEAEPCKTDKIAQAPGPFETDKIAKALMTAPIVPPEAQDLASSFLEQTLPKLLTDDSRLAHQLGFDDSRNETVTLDRALPLMRIYRNDILGYLKTQLDPCIKARVDPFSVVNNINNWRLDAGNLIAKRLVFPVKINNASSESESWLSVTLEQSPLGAWRIIQVGAPKLSRAIKRFETKPNHFLLWIPDLNRHFLGHVSPGRSDVSNFTITLTALFDDTIIRWKDEHGEEHTRKAGEDFEATSEEFIIRLKKLYEDLDLPRKLRSQSDGQAQSPIQQRPIQSR